MSAPNCWRQLSAYCVEHHTGQWRISKAYIGAPETTGPKYLLWSLEDARWVMADGVFDSADEAVQAAPIAQEKK